MSYTKLGLRFISKVFKYGLHFKIFVRTKDDPKISRIIKYLQLRL